MTDGPQQPYDPQQGWNTPRFPPTGTAQDPWRAHTAVSPSATEPDWSALAEESEAAARRRRMLFLAGGGVLVAAAVAAAVATAVVSSGGKKPDPLASDGPSESQSQPLPPEPTFSDVTPPPPPNPLDFISGVEKDTAPLSDETLFPGKKLVWKGRTYTEAGSTSSKNCTAAAKGVLAAQLGANECRQIIRATYTSDGFAVTVGVAVFDDAATAAKLKSTKKTLLPLAGGGVPDFCRQTVCNLTANAVGRYTYFTITGFTDNRPLTKADTAALQGGPDISDYTFSRIVQRGKDQANASVTEAGQ